MVVVALWFGLAASVSASTVDFASFTTGDRGPVVAFDHGLVVETTGGSVIVYGPDGPLPGLCPYGRGSACRGDLSIIFFGPVTGLGFTLDPTIPAGAVAVTFYDGDTPVAEVAAGGAAPVTAPDGATVTRARLSFSGAGSGGGGLGGSLRSAAYDTSAPALSTLDALLPGDETPQGRPVQSELLDFTLAEALDSRRYPRSIRVPGATISVIDSQEIYVYRPLEYDMPATAGICALRGGFVCLGDFVMVFDTLIRDLSFDALYYKPGDLALVRLFSGDTLLTERSITGDGEVSFFGFAGISHIEILNRSQSDAKGFGYANFRYSIYQPAPVPVPAAGLTLATSLALLAGAGAWRSRRTKGRPG